MKKDISYGFIGAGNMAKTLIRGLLASDTPTPSIIASTATSTSCEQLVSTFAIDSSRDNNACLQADVIILAVKPQSLPDVLSNIDIPTLASKLIITVIAGIPCRYYQQHIGTSIHLIRSMPNMPAMIGLGMTALYATNCCGEERLLAERLMASVGKTLWLEDEAGIDYATAISGSGPAYFYQFMHHLAQAGQGLGLPYQTALQLVIQTGIGATQLAEQRQNGSDNCIASLLCQVTSKGGTTMEAMRSFAKNDFAATIEQAVNACYQRAMTLSKPSNQTQKSDEKP